MPLGSAPSPDGQIVRRVPRQHDTPNCDCQPAADPIARRGHPHRAFFFGTIRYGKVKGRRYRRKYFLRRMEGQTAHHIDCAKFLCSSLARKKKFPPPSLDLLHSDTNSDVELYPNLLILTNANSHLLPPLPLSANPSLFCNRPQNESCRPNGSPRIDHILQGRRPSPRPT